MLSLVFELMKCELFDHLNDVIRIDENETKEIIRNILTAINHLHSKRIIHRDIKLVSTFMVETPIILY